MNSTEFLRVYATSVLGARVLFVFRKASRRLVAAPPLQLLGFVSVNTLSGEFHSQSFHSEYKQYLPDEIRSFIHQSWSDAAFEKMCKYSQSVILMYLKECAIAPDESSISNILFK